MSHLKNAFGNLTPLIGSEKRNTNRNGSNEILSPVIVNKNLDPVMGGLRLADTILSRYQTKSTLDRPQVKPNTTTEDDRDAVEARELRKYLAKQHIMEKSSPRASANKKPTTTIISKYLKTKPNHTTTTEPIIEKVKEYGNEAMTRIQHKIMERAQSESDTSDSSASDFETFMQSRKKGVTSQTTTLPSTKVQVTQQNEIQSDKTELKEQNETIRPNVSMPITMPSIKNMTNNHSSISNISNKSLDEEVESASSATDDLDPISNEISISPVIMKSVEPARVVALTIPTPFQKIVVQETLPIVSSSEEHSVVGTLTDPSIASPMKSLNEEKEQTTTSVSMAGTLTNTSQSNSPVLTRKTSIMVKSNPLPKPTPKPTKIEKAEIEQSEQAVQTDVEPTIVSNVSLKANIPFEDKLLSRRFHSWSMRLATRKPFVSYSTKKHPYEHYEPRVDSIPVLVSASTPSPAFDTTAVHSLFDKLTQQNVTQSTDAILRVSLLFEQSAIQSSRAQIDTLSAHLALARKIYSNA